MASWCRAFNSTTRRDLLVIVKFAPQYQPSLGLIFTPSEDDQLHPSPTSFKTSGDVFPLAPLFSERCRRKSETLTINTATAKASIFVNQRPAFDRALSDDSFGSEFVICA
jgi:hypothetical protein